MENNIDNINLDNIDDKIPMTLEKYLENPSGTKNNTFLNLAMIRKTLDERYLEMGRGKKKIKLNFYEKDKDNIYVHASIPSETYDLEYDVVLEISTAGNILKNQTFKVFSNSPSFVYTYAYTFNIYGLLIDELKDKYSPEVLTKEPAQKNYFKIISYEKSIYYAIMFLLTEYSATAEIVKKAKKIDLKSKSNLFNIIMTNEDKIDEYTRKRKREQYLRKHDIGKAIAHVIKKDINQRQKKKEKLYGSASTTDRESINKSSHKLIPKAKITGKSAKSKLRGKSKIK